MASPGPEAARTTVANTNTTIGGLVRSASGPASPERGTLELVPAAPLCLPDFPASCFPLRLRSPSL